MDADDIEWAGDDPWWEGPDVFDVPEGPDALDLVCEVADMMSVCAAVTDDLARWAVLLEAGRSSGG